MTTLLSELLIRHNALRLRTELPVSWVQDNGRWKWPIVSALASNLPAHGPDSNSNGLDGCTARSSESRRNADARSIKMETVSSLSPYPDRMISMRSNAKLRHTRISVFVWSTGTIFLWPNKPDGDEPLWNDEPSGPNAMGYLVQRRVLISGDQIEQAAAGDAPRLRTPISFIFASTR
jgi:hypothetical protein